MKRILTVTLLIIACFFGLQAQTYNYAEALQKSICFYDAEKCGPGINGGLLTWRGDCHVSDQVLPLNAEMTNMSASFINASLTVLDPDGSGTLDVSGGYHDAGDHVQFGLPQSYSSSTIEWAMYEFRDAFVQIGEYDHMMDILQWASDYYIKSTYRNSAGDVVAFCYQVGEGNIDHNLWAPPELVNTDEYPRPAYFATSETPASDQCAGAAASLAISYLNNLQDDAAYAAKCLDYAEALYDFAENNRGLGYSGGFYNSSYDEDELAWAAIWLHIATGDEVYLTDIIRKDANGMYTGWMSSIINSSQDQWQNIWVHSWDTKWGGIFAKLAPITDDPFHWYIFRWNLEYWSGVQHEEGSDGNYLATTPGGFSYLNSWGSARYNAAAQFQGMVYKKYADSRFDAWMTDQMNYILGDNPLNKSYIVGYSDNHVMHPHHRAAHGSPNNSMFNPAEHKHTLWGALAGGPGPEDEHVDETNDFIYNEVAIDYNAGLVGALAGHVAYFGAGQQPVADFPPADPVLIEHTVEARIHDETEAGSQITIRVRNEAAFPPRREIDIKALYFFNITELMEFNQSIGDVSFTTFYDENAVNGDPVVATGPIPYDAANGIYYMEFQWPESGFYGTREYQFGLLAGQDANYTSHWDPTNDYSRQGFGSSYSLSDYIPLYAENELVVGSLPGDPGSNLPPDALVSASPVSGSAPLAVSFNGSASSDPDGDLISYTWDFGDGTGASGESTTHTYTTDGSFLVSLTVSDGELSDMATLTISVGTVPANNPPTAIATASPVSGSVPLVVSFNGTGSSDPDDDALTYSWNFGDGTTATGASVNHTYIQAGTFGAILTVSDGEFSDQAVTSINVGETPGEPTCDLPVAISLPFTQNGAGAYCWVTNGTIDNINSWNVSVLEINGVDVRNRWTNELPPRIGGNYYIYYEANLAWAALEIIGTSGPQTSYSLTTSVIGQGSVTPSGGTYTSGTAVSITANPAAGYQFDEWTGDASGTSVSTTITMSADKSVTASFSQIPTTTYTLSTSVTGQGSISTDPPASGGVYAEGTVVSLTATPASGYQFDGWSGALSGNINPGSITMNSNKSVTATFEENGTPGCDNPVTISIPFVQNGSGTYCWVTTTEMAYINSWNLNSLIINGLDFTNTWSYNLPAAQNGQWFIEYDASFGWSHFEAPQAKSSYDKAVIEGTQGISIFPNPFTSEFQVNFSRETGVSLIEVMDMTGKIVFRKTPGGKYSEIAIGADLQPGNYLLRVTTTDEVFTTIVRKK